MMQGLDSTQQGRIGRATTASRVHRPRPRQTPSDGPDSVIEMASSWRRTLTFCTSCFLTASISHILSWEANRVCTHEPRRLTSLPLGPSSTVGACPNWQRDAPPSCAPATPPAGRHAQRARRPRIRQEPPRQAAARRTSGTASPGSPPQQQAKVPPRRKSMPPLSAATNGGQWARVGPVCARCPTRRPRQRAEAESRRGARLLRAESSDPHINPKS